MARRITRQRRAARPARPNPRAATIPSADYRRRRGPRPPDHITARLVTALTRDLAAAPGRADAASVDDPAPAPGRPGRRWLAALAAAGGALVRAARRGVVGALATAGLAALAATNAPAPPPPPAALEELTAEVTESVERHRAGPGGATLTAAVLAALAAGIIAGFVLREHARLVQAIARAAGADQYVWTTMRDERVRPLHVALEGTLQRWDSPPLAGLPDFHGHPGEAAGPCRCQAFPIVRGPHATRATRSIATR
jgi:hypothetical protein